VERRCGAGRRPEKEGGRVGLPGLGLAPLRHEPCPSIHEGSLGAGERTARRVTPTVRGRGYRRLRLGTGPWLWLLGAGLLPLSLLAPATTRPVGYFPPAIYIPRPWGPLLSLQSNSLLSLSLHDYTSLSTTSAASGRHPLSQSISLHSLPPSLFLSAVAVESMATRRRIVVSVSTPSSPDGEGMDKRCAGMLSTGFLEL